SQLASVTSSLRSMACTPQIQCSSLFIVGDRARPGPGRLRFVPVFLDSLPWWFFLGSAASCRRDALRGEVARVALRRAARQRGEHDANGLARGVGPAERTR